MPRAKSKNASGLEILLHPPADPASPTTSGPSASPDWNPTYRPGSQITGTVSLTSTADVPIGTVQITFYGRAKVKIVQSQGQSTSEYRSRANFFTIEQTLFEGGYTFKSGKYDWPFSLTFPSEVDANCLRGGTDKKGRAKVRFKPRGEGFLSTEGADKLATTDPTKYQHEVAGHTLPPTMQYYHGQFGRQAWGYVEYVLVATLTEPEASNSIFKSSPKKRFSIRVIDFVPEQTQGSIKDWGFTNETHHPTVRTSKLQNAALIDSANAKYGGSGSPPDRFDTGDSTSSFFKTASQKSAPEVQGLEHTSSKDDPITGTSRRTSSLFSRLSLSNSNPSSIFSRSSTPRLTLQATVTYPTTIQVAHPDPIPLYLSITPDTAGTTLQADQLPKVLVKSLSFTIVCCTKTRCNEWKLDQKDFKTVNIKLCQNFPINQTIELVPSTPLAVESGSRAYNLVEHTPERKDAKPSSKEGKNAKLVANEKLKSPQPLASSFSTNANSHSHPIINLGAIANLRLQSAKLGRIKEPLLVPSFATYNITRVFGLKYIIELEILGTGKTEKIKGEVPKGNITVVAAPDDVRDKMTAGAEGLPGYDDLDLEGLADTVDDDDAEHEEQVEMLQSSKGREAGDEKKGVMRERREHEAEDGEEALPRYER